jgi:hypothetical protein
MGRNVGFRDGGVPSPGAMHRKSAVVREPAIGPPPAMRISRSTLLHTCGLGIPEDMRPKYLTGSRKTTFGAQAHGDFYRPRNAHILPRESALNPYNSYIFDDTKTVMARRLVRHRICAIRVARMMQPSEIDYKFESEGSAVRRRYGCAGIDSHAGKAARTRRPARSGASFDEHHRGIAGRPGDRRRSGSGDPLRDPA